MNHDRSRARGRDDPPGLTPLRAGIERVLSHLGAPEVDATTELVDHWAEIVGPELASRVEAVAVRGSELIVRVTDPAWASQLSWLEPQLLDRVSARIGRGRIDRITPRVDGPARRVRTRRST